MNQRCPTLKYLIPQIALADLPSMIRVALFGGIVAGMYGVLHDQITYSISPKYFTKLKFPQFRYADFGLGERVFASVIGFLATWWVGLIAGWILARRLFSRQARHHAYRQIRNGIACILAFGFSFGGMGYIFRLWRGPHADYSSWTWVAHEFNITDTWSFVRVAGAKRDERMIVGVYARRGPWKPQISPTGRSIPPKQSDWLESVRLGSDPISGTFDDSSFPDDCDFAAFA